MRQQLLDLFEIQKIDLQIRELVLAKEALPKRLNELTTHADSARTKINELTEQRNQLLGEIKEHESAVQAETEKVRKWERRLTDIRNQREYQALSREVEGSKRAIRSNEEQLIELMAKKEELDSSLDRAQDELAVHEVDSDAERAEVDRQVAELDAKIEEHLARRRVLEPKIKKNLLTRYEAVRQKRLGVGLVAAANGSCTGCNMRLPPQLYNILMRVDTLELCPSCQRILVFQGVLEEHEAPAQASGEPPSASEIASQA